MIRLRNFIHNQPETNGLINYECIVTLDFESILSTSTIQSETRKVKKRLIELFKEVEFRKKANIVMVDHLS